MIKCSHSLIPHGIGEHLQIGNLYIINVGKHTNDTYSYWVMYVEPRSEFSPGIRRYKLVVDYDRNQPLFELLSLIYKKSSWIDEEDMTNKYVVRLFKSIS